MQANSLRTQQARPPFFPPLMPSESIATGMEQTPYCAIFLPPGSLPHFLNSQQFTFLSAASIKVYFFELIHMIMEKIQTDTTGYVNIYIERTVF
jgi:hypothetical protein